MTAPAPSPLLSPTAGAFNAIVRHLNDRLAARISELLLLLAAETERGHALATAADYQASLAAGYIDRTGLET